MCSKPRTFFFSSFYGQFTFQMGKIEKSPPYGKGPCTTKTQFLNKWQCQYFSRYPLLLPYFFSVCFQKHAIVQPVMSSTRPCPACSHQDHPAETIIPFLPHFHSLFPCISGIRYVGKVTSLCIKNSAIRVSLEKARTVGKVLQQIWCTRY